MGDHFTLDIHPHRLRAAAHSLDVVRQSLTQHAKTSTHEPAAIGTKWTGYAATSVTAEMTAVGGHLSTFATQLLHCSTALTTLAGHYEKAQTTLADLNTKWAKTETDYQSACDDADAAYKKSYDQLKGPHGEAPNRGITMDLDDSRSSAKSSAYQAQQKAQGTLETDFATLKAHLTTQTTTCGAALSSNIPVKNLGVCTASNPTGLDHSNLLTDLTLVSDYEDLKRHTEDDQNTADAAAPEIAALQKALDEHDRDAIQKALQAIKDHEEGPYGADYSKALIDALGKDPAAVAKAVNGIYNDLDDAISSGNANVAENWSGIKALTDALSRGLAQYSDADYGKFFGTLSTSDQGAQQLALLASSGYADSRQTSGALALQSRWYDHVPTTQPGLFPEALSYAYDGVDMVDYLSERASGTALAHILEHTSADQLDYILDSMTLTMQSDMPMSKDKIEVELNLLGETMIALKDDYMTDARRTDTAVPTLLLKVLDRRFQLWGEGASYDRDEYDAIMRTYLQQITGDTDFVRNYIKQSWNLAGDFPPSELAKLLKDSGADVDQIISKVISAEVASDTNPDEIARFIGQLMKDQDLGALGIDYKEAGLAGVKDVVESLISGAADSNPITAAAYGPLKAIFDSITEQQQKIDDAYKGWDDAAVKNATEEQLAIALYIKVHGAPPPGYDTYMNTADHRGNPKSSNLYFTHITASNEPGDIKAGAELRKYYTMIDEARDES
jgi:hypothetical protein